MILWLYILFIYRDRLIFITLTDRDLEACGSRLKLGGFDPRPPHISISNRYWCFCSLKVEGFRVGPKNRNGWSGVFLCNEPLLLNVYGQSQVAFSYFPAIIYRGSNDCCKLDPTINSPFLYTTKNGCFCDLHQEKDYFSRESDRFTQSTPLIKQWINDLDLKCIFTASCSMKSKRLGKML